MKDLNFDGGLIEPSKRRKMMRVSDGSENKGCPRKDGLERSVSNDVVQNKPILTTKRDI